MTLGTKLLRLRESKGLTREGMASEVNVSKVAYGRWESDLCKPKMDNLIRLCIFYHLSFEELLEDVDSLESLPNMGFCNKLDVLFREETITNASLLKKLVKNQNEILKLVEEQRQLLSGLYDTKQ